MINTVTTKALHWRFFRAVRQKDNEIQALQIIMQVTKKDLKHKWNMITSEALCLTLIRVVRQLLSPSRVSFHLNVPTDFSILTYDYIKHIPLQKWRLALELSKLYSSLGEAMSLQTLQHCAFHVYLSALECIPALIRSWCNNNMDRKSSAIIERYFCCVVSF